MDGMKRAGKPGVSAALLTIFFMAACQSGPPQISIEDARAELSPALAGEAMVVCRIVNQGGPDLITGVKTNIPGATASFHVMQGNRMVPVDMLDVRAKSSIEFKMDGGHIMIEHMPGTMKEGAQFTVTLVFEKAGEKQVPLTLRKASVPMMPGQHG